MASVVFLRAVNVGGRRKFQPSTLAKQLAGFSVVNIGAAGTFVARGRVGQSKLCREILRRLPFKPELMICPARDVVALTHNDSFRDASSATDVSRFVSVMQKAPRVTNGKCGSSQSPANSR